MSEIKPTLMVLAAGMGSRYGGLKQLDGVGPCGETIMDFSIYDAVRAGFGRVVFVIRKDFAEEFEAKVAGRYRDQFEGRLGVEVVFQSVEDLPEGFTCPEGRTKPWGTNHAVLMGKGVINEPFGVINADDFYGAESFQVLGDELRAMAGGHNRYCMVGYRVGNTLSESGTVARGVCEVDHEGLLTEVVERTAIARDEQGEIAFQDEAGRRVVLEEQTPVSMNMWGFTPEYFDYSEEAFIHFLEANLHNEKGEFYIPTVVNDLVKRGIASCKVLDTSATWFGVTYAADRPDVVAKLEQLTKKGVYPSPLLKK